LLVSTQERTRQFF